MSTCTHTPGYSNPRCDPTREGDNTDRQVVHDTALNVTTWSRGAYWGGGYGLHCILPLSYDSHWQPTSFHVLMYDLLKWVVEKPEAPGLTPGGFTIRSGPLLLQRSMDSSGPDYVSGPNNLEPRPLDPLAVISLTIHLGSPIVHSNPHIINLCPPAPVHLKNF